MLTHPTANVERDRPSKEVKLQTQGPGLAVLDHGVCVLQEQLVQACDRRLRALQEVVWGPPPLPTRER